MFTIKNWRIEEMTGYKPQTTFYTDFSIAEKFGLKEIEKTYRRAFRHWKDDRVYLTELCMVLSWKLFRWHEVDDDKAKLYNKLWGELDAWIMENWKGEDLDYFLKTTD